MIKFKLTLNIEGVTQPFPLTCRFEGEGAVTYPLDGSEEDEESDGFIIMCGLGLSLSVDDGNGS